MPKVSPSPRMECLCSWKSTNAQLIHCHRWQHPLPACRHRISNTALRIQPQRGCTTLCRSAGHIEDGCGDSAHCPRGPVAGPHPEAHCTRPPGGLHLQYLPQAGSRLRALCPQGGLHSGPLLWPTRMAWLLPCLPWLTKPCVSCHSLMYLTLQINSLLCLTLQIKLLRVSCCL